MLRRSIIFFGLIPIFIYRGIIRPLIPRSCKFSPTCSEYAMIAIKRHGIIMGWIYAMRRLVKCRPFSKRSGGHDPVPFKLKGGAKWVV